MAFVLYIEFANDPPRVAVFDTFREAEACLDYFEVEMFDPPINDALLKQPCRARIFECKDVSWGTEVDIAEWRRQADKIRGDSLAVRFKAGEIISLADAVNDPPGVADKLAVLEATMKGKA